MVYYTLYTTILKYINSLGNDMDEDKAEDPKRCEFQYLEDTLYMIGGKWTLLVMHSIASGNHRFTDIKNSLQKITPRALSNELKKLEMNNIIKRTEYEDGPVTVDYEITSYCKSFEPIISEMIDWGKKHRQYLKDQAKEK